MLVAQHPATSKTGLRCNRACDALISQAIGHNIMREEQGQAIYSAPQTASQERDAALAERDLALAERDAALAERDAALAERDAALAASNDALIERDAARAERDALAAAQNVSMPGRTHGAVGMQATMHKGNAQQHRRQQQVQLPIIRTHAQTDQAAVPIQPWEAAVGQQTLIHGYHNVPQMSPRFNVPSSQPGELPVHWMQPGQTQFLDMPQRQQQQEQRNTTEGATSTEEQQEPTQHTEHQATDQQGRPQQSQPDHQPLDNVQRVDIPTCIVQWPPASAISWPGNAERSEGIPVTAPADTHQVPRDSKGSGQSSGTQDTLTLQVNKHGSTLGSMYTMHMDSSGGWVPQMVPMLIPTSATMPPPNPAPTYPGAFTASQRPPVATPVLVPDLPPPHHNNPTPPAGLAHADMHEIPQTASNVSWHAASMRVLALGHPHSQPAHSRCMEVLDTAIHNPAPAAKGVQWQGPVGSDARACTPHTAAGPVRVTFCTGPPPDQPPQQQQHQMADMQIMLQPPAWGPQHELLFHMQHTPSDSHHVSMSGYGSHTQAYMPMHPMGHQELQHGHGQANGVPPQSLSQQHGLHSHMESHMPDGSMGMAHVPGSQTAAGSGEPVANSVEAMSLPHMVHQHHEGSVGQWELSTCSVSSHSAAPEGWATKGHGTNAGGGYAEDAWQGHAGVGVSQGRSSSMTFNTGAAMKAIRLGHAHASTSSAYLGVTWYKSSKRWQARLCCDNKKFHLGYFSTEVEAARAYDRAVIEYKGPNAPRNFVDSYKGGAPQGNGKVLGPIQLMKNALAASKGGVVMLDAAACSSLLNLPGSLVKQGDDIDASRSLLDAEETAAQTRKRLRTAAWNPMPDARPWF